MRISTSLLVGVLGLVDAVWSLSLRIDTTRPEALPPEDQRIHLRRAKAAENITIPLPLSVIPTSPPSPVPTPMDLSLSYALSDSCLLYLTSVLSSTTFKSCLPFSLLLTTSSSFASLLSDSLEAGNLTTINELIAYTSSPGLGSDTCDQYFSGVLSALSSKSNCAADLGKGMTNTAIAKEAQAGVGNYKLMRQASVIVDPDTGKYCYLQAVASSTPDDLYLWSIPSGTLLPSSTKPTCSKCSSLLLNHYSNSLNTTSTLNGTILQNAINVVNNQCGPSFASYSAASRGAASRAFGIRWETIGFGGFMGVLALGGVLL